MIHHSLDSLEPDFSVTIRFPSNERENSFNFS